MYKVLVLDRDGDEFEYEAIVDYLTIGGSLQLFHADGSITLYAPEAWLEGVVSSVDNPQVGDHQL